MLLAVLLILLMVINWFFSEILIVYPLQIIHSLSLYSPWIFFSLLGLFVAWCVGDNE
jgi:hypothetical protein